MPSQLEPLNVYHGDEKAALAHATVLQNALNIFRRSYGRPISLEASERVLLYMKDVSVKVGPRTSDCLTIYLTMIIDFHNRVQSIRKEA